MGRITEKTDRKRSRAHVEKTALIIEIIAGKKKRMSAEILDERDEW